MDRPRQIILTPFNYFEWKSQIVILLWSKGVYMITMRTQTEPISAMEKEKWFNRMDEAFVLLCLSISPELLFHIETTTTPNKARTTLEGRFGKQDVLRGHQLKNEFISLSPSNFDTIQNFFIQFKSLLTKIKLCGIDKKEDQLILFVLSKLGLEYSVFVSTFHSIELAMGAAWKMPPMDVFVDSLTCEQDKLVQMDALSHQRCMHLQQMRSLATNSNKRSKARNTQNLKRTFFTNLLRRPPIQKGVTPPC